MEAEVILMNTEVFYKHENTSKVSGLECAHAGNFQGRSLENSGSWGILQWYQGLQRKSFSACVYVNFVNSVAMKEDKRKVKTDKTPG